MINRQHLEAVSNSAQNDAIALAEVYREVFAKKFNAEVESALNEELSASLKEHSAIAEAIVNSVATAYADTISIQSQTIKVKVLKPKRELKPHANLQALLPPEKPKLRAMS